MVQECVSWVIRRTVSNMYIYLNHSSRYKHNKLEKCYEKPRQAEKFLDNFDIEVFFVNGESAL